METLPKEPILKREESAPPFSTEQREERYAEPKSAPKSDVAAIQENYHKAMDEAQEKINLALADVQAKSEEIQKYAKDNERYQRQAELVLQEFAQYKKAAQEQLEHKGTLLADYQQTMAEQKAVIEKKQHQIAQLESKVRDLTYEIKTLLQLAELGNQPLDAEIRQSFLLSDSAPPPSYYLETDQEDLPSIPESQVRTFEEAASQLKRCVDIAQKMTGAGYFSGSSRLRDIHEDHYAIDLRRLFDSLRSEKGGALLFYSQKENRLLFVNALIRNLVGWSPDKFVQSFPEIVQQGMEEWNKALALLLSQPEVKISFIIKSKTGSDVLVNGVLGVIPTGLFKHHVMGVLYPA